MKIINLMAHSITDITTGKHYKPCGLVIRAKSVSHKIEEYKNVNVFRYENTLEVPLPEPQPDTLYVVSNMALNAVPKNRTDVVGPGPVEKDENGKPVGCRGFRRLI